MIVASINTGIKDRDKKRVGLGLSGQINRSDFGITWKKLVSRVLK